ncbi:MAG: hypothetical protein IPK60_06560 [Sandaracinaceae bacterium]|nr:hypothetical protein [Sandaracinaceae bacterium]
MGVARAFVFVVVLAGSLTKVAAQDQQSPAWHPPISIVPTQGPGYPIQPPARPAPPPPPDLRLARSNVAADFNIFVMTSPVSSFDRTLGARGISSEAHWGANLAVVGRVANWFWMGARGGFHRRSFDTATLNVMAYGFSMQGTAQARFALGENVDAFAHVDAGLAHAGVSYNGVFDGGVVPHLSSGVGVGIWVVGDLRAFLSFDYHYYFTPSVNSMKDDVDLGGMAFGLGMEWRPSSGAEE